MKKIVLLPLILILLLSISLNIYQASKIANYFDTDPPSDSLPVPATSPNELTKVEKRMVWSVAQHLIRNLDSLPEVYFMTPNSYQNVLDLYHNRGGTYEDKDGRFIFEFYNLTDEMINTFYTIFPSAEYFVLIDLGPKASNDK